MDIMPQTSIGHVFMSYSRRDTDVMRRIVTFLREQGIKVWVDNEKLVPGTPIWEEEIEKAIKGTSAIVVVLSPDAKNSEWVRREIALADQYRKRIFPMLAGGDEDSSISLRLITRQFIDIRDNENAGLSSLSTSILFYLEELETQQRIEREEADKLARAQAERQAAEREAERSRLERNAAEKATLEAVEKAAYEQAEREAAQREVARLTAEKEAADEALREAKERAAKEKVERAAARKAAFVRFRRKYLLPSSIAVLFLGLLTFWVTFFAPFPNTESLPVISETNIDQVTQIARRNILWFASVYSVTFSPDGDILASAGTGNDIRLWRVKNGSLLKTLSGDAVVEGFVDLAFSPDGQSLASGSDTGNTVYIWRVSDGSLIHKLEGHTEGIHSVAFSPDGQTLASGSRDGTIRLWQVSDGSVFRVLIPENNIGYIWGVAFSPDGKILATGHSFIFSLDPAEDNLIHLWGVSDGSLLKTLHGHSHIVFDIAFSPDGSLIASGSADGTFRLWGLKP
jgi:hypothetical protein